MVSQASDHDAADASNSCRDTSTSTPPSPQGELGDTPLSLPELTKTAPHPLAEAGMPHCSMATSGLPHDLNHLRKSIDALVAGTHKRKHPHSTTSSDDAGNGDEDSDSDSGKRTKMNADEETDPCSRDKVDMHQLRRSCDQYENQLFHCIVESEHLKTRYEDVRVHRTAKRSIQSLGLFLRHPGEFAYGVLAGSGLSGLLLYGPPGTGKTMLVRAFAHESGANILDISAADVLNMYVGEGEKSIRAIFSLARKLHPCVVFMDEADGIFGKRAEKTKESSRTMMNQFLREWDGLTSGANNRGAVLIVATNRPFDLDDAVLRRLPQRILIDIPEVEGRTEILSSHLKSERLDPDVQIDVIASSTPHYTGSDLKNLAIAAALHSVRERDAATLPEAASQGGSSPNPNPYKRTIKMQHLLKARDEIRPATSKDTLRAIREFHCNHGNTSKLD